MIFRPASTPHILLGGIVISGISTFMLYPVLVFRLLDVGLTIGQVGLVLGFLSGTGRLCSFLIGSANNRLGSKVTVCVGLLLRVVGIAAFALDTHLIAYVSCAALSSFGSSAAALGIKTELLRISASRRYITLRSMAINSGAIIGPAVGAALYHFFSFHAILYISIASYLILIPLFLFTAFAPPEARSSENGNRVVTTRGARNYVVITIIASMYWAIYSQWSVIVPLFAESVFGYKEASNGVYMLNAIIVLALQYPLLVVLLKSVKDQAILLLGFVSFVATFAMLLPLPSVLTIMVFSCLFSVSELLISPTLDSQTAKLAPSRLGLTRSYGVQDTITGVFSIGGSTVGGWLIEFTGGTHGSALLALPSAVIAMAVLIFVRKERTP